MPLSPQEELELIEIEQETRRRKAGGLVVEGGPQQQGWPGMELEPDKNFEPDNAPSELAQLGKSAISALPAAGAAVGGMMGGTAGSIIPGGGTAIGAVTGAGLGGMAGDIAKNAIEHVAFPEDAPQTGMQGVTRMAGSGIQGAEQETGARAAVNVIGPVIRGTKNTLSEIGEGLTNWAKDASAATTGQTRNQIVDFGLNKTRKMGEYLMKLGMTNKPAFLTTVERQATATKKELGQALSDGFDEISADTANHVTKGNLIRGLQENAAKQFAEKGLPMPEGMAEEIAGHVKQAVPDMHTTVYGGLDEAATLSPAQTWQLAQTWERAAGSWRRSLGGAATDSKAVVLDTMANGIRDLNSVIANNSGRADLGIISQNYSLMKEASEKLISEVAAGRTKTNLFSLKGLEKIYRNTAASQPVRGTATRIAQETGKAVTGISRLVAKTPSKLGPYAPRLTAAAARGVSALAIEHFKLSQSDPNYQKLMSKLAESQ